MSNNNGYGGLFANTGSPPVILGFLAVGLFVVALVVVFGFRRMHNGRFNNPHQNLLNLNTIPSHNIGQKPALWELYVHRDEERWGGMQPISASLDGAEHTPLPPIRRLTILQRLLRRLRFRRRHPPLPPDKPTHPSTNRTIQVAVVIVMPSSPSVTKHGHDTPIYELGVTVLPFVASTSLDPSR